MVSSFTHSFQNFTPEMVSVGAKLLLFLFYLFGWAANGELLVCVAGLRFEHGTPK